MLPLSAPSTIRGDVLDYYLAQGYYRMQQDLFTCQFVSFEGQPRTAHWLRLTVAGIIETAAHRRLRRRNAGLAVAIRPFRLGAEYEELYARYRAAITFEAAETVEETMLGGHSHNVFHSYAIELRDGGQLVAVGLFDVGQRTLAGILNFYDPAYHRYSLGKYLLLLKTDFAVRHQLNYYYPGYVVQGNPKFDYKLFVCPAATEVFDSLRQTWEPFAWETVAAHSAELLGLLPAAGLKEAGLEG
jgi:leucyl-tRNA---protein transferase